VDFGVVADVDGELRVEIEKFDRERMLVGKGKGAEFTGEAAGFAGVGDDGFDDERGTLAAEFAETDEGTTGDARVGAEDLFAGFGVERAMEGFHAFSFATAEPEAAGGVEVAAVAHAVPDGATGGGAELRVES
jgi:hypothetical protein